MDCGDVKRRLSAYLDGELGGLLAAAVSDHLKACEGCSEEMRRMQSAWDLLGVVCAPDPPAGLPGKIMERIESGEEDTRLPFEWRRISAWPLNLLAAAALFTAIVLGALLGNGFVSIWRGGGAAGEIAQAEKEYEEIFSELPQGSVAWYILESISAGTPGKGKIEEDAK